MLFKWDSNLQTIQLSWFNYYYLFRCPDFLQMYTLHVPWLQLHKSETELLDCYCWYYSLECWILIGCVIVWEVSSFLFRCVWYWTFSKIKTMVNVDLLYECLLSIHFYASIYILKGWSCDLGALDGLFQRYYDCYLSTSYNTRARTGFFLRF